MHKTPIPDICKRDIYSIFILNIVTVLAVYIFSHCICVIFFQYDAKDCNITT